jgi:hypothetical protein
MPLPYQDPFNILPPPVPAEPCMLEQLQAAAVRRIQTDLLFDGSSSTNTLAIPVLTEKIGDITYMIAEVTGQVGIVVVIMTPIFEFVSDLEISSALLGWGMLSVNIYENVITNQAPTGTQIRSIQAASRILALLHLYPTGLPIEAQLLEPNQPYFIALKRPLSMVNEGPPLSYSVNFKALVSLP